MFVLPAAFHARAVFVTLLGVPLEYGEVFALAVKWISGIVLDPFDNLQQAGDVLFGSTDHAKASVRAYPLLCLKHFLTLVQLRKGRRRITEVLRLIPRSFEAGPGNPFIVGMDHPALEANCF